MTMRVSLIIGRVSQLSMTCCAVGALSVVQFMLSSPGNSVFFCSAAIALRRMKSSGP